MGAIENLLKKHFPVLSWGQQISHAESAPFMRERTSPLDPWCGVTSLQVVVDDGVAVLKKTLAHRPGVTGPARCIKYSGTVFNLSGDRTDLGSYTSHLLFDLAMHRLPKISGDFEVCPE